MPLRTDAELQAAIDSMFRIRAVESPPGADGAREIWHQGAKGAELVSWVDAAGRVTRHELCLFEDVVVWDRAGGMRTGRLTERGATAGAKPSELVAYDTDRDAGDQRIIRVSRAVTPYAGDDKYILHVKKLLETARELADSVFQEEVTRPAELVTAELRRVIEAAARGQPPPKRNRAALLAVALGVLVIAAALVLLLSK